MPDNISTPLRGSKIAAKHGVRRQNCSRRKIILPDANWLNALKLPTKVLTGLFFACLILLIFDKSEILLLSTFGDVAKPLTILLCVVTGALSFTSIVAFFIDLLGVSKKHSMLQQRRAMRRSEQEQEIENQKERVIARITHLSNQELRYLADCLSNNSTTFNTYVHSPAATTLVSKGLAYTPGGIHNQDHYPFIVHDFVWEYLLGRRDEIIEMDRGNREAEDVLKRNRGNRRY